MLKYHRIISAEHEARALVDRLGDRCLERSITCFRSLAPNVCNYIIEPANVSINPFLGLLSFLFSTLDDSGDVLNMSRHGKIGGSL